MASNNSTISDPQGQYDDWIEIHNYGANTIDMAGMYLTDDLTDLKKWQFPAGTSIHSGDYLIIWADEDTSDAGLHASFKLNADGEEIALFESDGATLTDSVTFGAQRTDISYGRYPDGGDQWRFFGIPSPDEENESGYLGIVADTKFSHDRGFYDEPIYVTISTKTAEATIRYTTDGSAPDETYGQIYSGPIQISTTTCLRAMAYKSGWLSTNVDTQTYLFLDDVITQTQEQATDAGYPNDWGPYTAINGIAPADYEMDPQVTQDPEYAGLMREALLSIPTLSIATEKGYLFSDNPDPETGGIYIYTRPPGGTDLGDDWERPVSAEYFGAGDSEEFQINCGLRLHGGHSRRPEKSPKHSFRLVFRSEYGPTQLNYPLFGDDAAASFNTITLRAGFCNSWHHWDSSQRHRSQHIRDTWAKDTQLDMDQPAGNGLFVHLYLNGIYWGVYNATERIDGEFAQSYLGGDDEDYDIIKDQEMAVEGNWEAWNRMMSLANAGLAGNEAYQRIQGNNPDGTPNPDIEACVDVVNLIDYMTVNFYGGNTDWDHHNWIAVRNRVNPGKGFKFFSWDAEHILENTNHNMVNENNNNCPSQLFQRLRENADFRLIFADRVQLHCFNGGALTPQSAQERWMRRATEIDLAIIAESARWGDYRRDVHSYSSGPYYLYTKNDFWIPERDWLLTEYFPVRTNNLLRQFRENNLYPDIDAPVFYVDGSYQHGGPTAANSSFSMADTTGTIYYSLDGTDPRVPSTTEPSNQTMLVPENAPKLVLVPTGTISNNWTGGGTFNDQAWASGTGGIGYERNSGYQQYIDLDTEEQMYGENTTCYIRIPFTLDAGEYDFSTLTLKIRYDDGFIAYLNGEEIARRYFAGTPTWNSSADSTHTDSEAVNFEYIDISSYTDALYSGENILAIHGLNASPTSSDFLISVELVAVTEDSSPDSDFDVPTGVMQYTAAITLTESAHIKARALNGTTWSALSEATYAVGPVAENLRITEIMYHPQTQTEPNDPNEEFIELTNIGAETINLNLVKFTNGIDFTFPSVELAPGEYIVVVQDIEVFETRYGTQANIAGQYSASLANNGERIRLEDAIGQTILDFSYKDGWHDDTDGRGYSLVIINPLNSDPAGWDDKDSWRTGTNIGGSPGW